MTKWAESRLLLVKHAQLIEIIRSQNVGNHEFELFRKVLILHIVVFSFRRSDASPFFRKWNSFEYKCQVAAESIYCTSSSDQNDPRLAASMFSSTIKRFGFQFFISMLIILSI